MYYYGYDISYIVLVLPCILLSLWASSNVNSTFKKYSTHRSMHGITGAQAAWRVLQTNGVTGVRIERVSGNLTDRDGVAAELLQKNGVKVYTEEEIDLLLKDFT